MDRIQSLINKSTAIILVGGKSSRMNYKDKYKLKLKSSRFIDFLLQKLNFFYKTVIVYNENQNPKEVECDYIIDEIEGIGPIGGIYTAMSQVQSDTIFIASCDMPYINKEIILKLYSQMDDKYDCIIPCIGDRTYNLFGIYNCRIKDVVAENIKNSDYKIKNLLNKVNTKYVRFEEEDLKYFLNINTIEEYNEYCKCERFSA